MNEVEVFKIDTLENLEQFTQKNKTFIKWEQLENINKTTRNVIYRIINPFKLKYKGEILNFDKTEENGPKLVLTNDPTKKNEIVSFSLRKKDKKQFNTLQDIVCTKNGIEVKNLERISIFEKEGNIIDWADNLKYNEIYLDKEKYKIETVKLDNTSYVQAIDEIIKVEKLKKLSNKYSRDLKTLMNKKNKKAMIQSLSTKPNKFENAYNKIQFKQLFGILEEDKTDKQKINFFKKRLNYFPVKYRKEIKKILNIDNNLKKINKSNSKKSKEL